LLDNNLPQETRFPETPENELNQNDTGEELEQVRSRVIELEALVAQKDEELAKTNARVSELELVVAESDERLAQAVSSYKALVVKLNPGVLEELIVGDTIEDINASLERAETIVGKVRQGLEVEMASARVPAGAPERTPPDLSALSPSEKIQYAIGGRK
jgi:uncharacterized coiled-coil protein SlyX